MSGQSVIGDYIENLPLRLADRATRPLSPRARGAVADWLGRRIVLNLPSLRRRGDDNLKLIYPEMSADERLKILSNTAGNFGRTIFEMRQNHLLVERARAGEIPIVGDEALAALEAARAQGKGALMLSGHYGQWDSCRAALKVRGMETGGIYRNHDNRFFNKDMLPNFEACGKPLFPKGSKGMRSLIRHVSQGGFAAIMLDQRVSEGEWLDFMGHPALTATGLAALALKLKVPFIAGYGIRQPDKLSFVVELEPPISHTDARTMTQAANDSLAARIHADPTQWHWLHRRWADGKRISKSRQTG